MGPSLTLRARELNMHGAVPIFRWGKFPSPTGDTAALDLHMLQYLGGPSIIVPAMEPTQILPYAPQMAAAAAAALSLVNISHG